MSLILGEKTACGEQRRFYRLRYPCYPLACHPRIYLRGMGFIVTEMSEEGLRFDARPVKDFYPLQRITGKLAFTQGEVISVMGTILRIASMGEVVVYLSHGIPLSVMMREQLRLRSASINWGCNDLDGIE